METESVKASPKWVAGSAPGARRLGVDVATLAARSEVTHHRIDEFEGGHAVMLDVPRLIALLETDLLRD